MSNSNLIARLRVLEPVYRPGQVADCIREAADALEAAGSNAKIAEAEIDTYSRRCEGVEAKLAKAREAIKLLIAHAKTSDAREGHTRCREVDMATAILKEIGHD